MDVYKALSELYDEKHRLDTAISALEARLALLTKPDGTVRGRRGRRSMGMDEREEVSRRMSRYWAERRANKRKMQVIPSSFPALIPAAAVAAGAMSAAAPAQEVA